MKYKWELHKSLNLVVAKSCSPKKWMCWLPATRSGNQPAKHIELKQCVCFIGFCCHDLGSPGYSCFFACWLVGICFAQWYPMGENTNVLWYVNVFMFYHGKYACLILWFRFVLQLFSGHVQTCALGRSRAEGCETCKHQEINRTWKHQNAKWAAIRIGMC